MLQSYTKLSRTERIGFGALTLLILVLVIVRFTMHYWVKPVDSFSADNQFTAAWRTIKETDPPQRTPRQQWAKDTINFSAQLFAFDPNTIDSSGLLHLGFTPRLAHGLLNWRGFGKHFYKKEELKKLYNMTPEFYARLEPYISIAESTAGSGFQRYGNGGNTFQPWPEREAAPQTVELNTVDSATLVRLRGIGPYTAHKIIERRDALGGFISIAQLKEVYGLRDTLLQQLEAHATVNPQKIKKMDLNSVTIAQLKAHPYVGDKIGQFILLYRDGLKGYRNVEQLRQAPMMDEEKYRKIAPYFTVN